jgi:cytochrome c biogenesis protein CcdA/thiol-disulfide isomerase/thioredoxin
MQSGTELILRKTTIGLSITLIILLCSSAVSSVIAQTPSLSNTTSSAKNPSWPVNLYEFYRTDCPHCQAIAPQIDALARQYPTLHVYKIETQNDANYSLFQKFLKAYNLTIDSVPTIFIGKKAFQGGEESMSAVQAEVTRAIQSGSTSPGDQIMGNTVPTPAPISRTNNATSNATTSDDGTEFQGSFPLPLFITTGIISGLNPCVFSVLIFLMGTIALTGSRTRALAIGVAYIATVFFVFFLSALAVVQFVRIIGASNLQLTKTLIGIFLLIVGIVSIKDFFWYNRWFSFKIPTFTKGSISSLGKTGSFIGIIALGFIATIAALPCTIGPFTYFSTTYLTSMSTVQNNLYTVLFSFAFVIPMILVFIAIYAVKVSTDRAEEWRMKSARYMRLIAGLLMVTFGLLLVFKVF